MSEESIVARFGEFKEHNLGTGEAKFSVFPIEKHRLQQYDGSILCFGRPAPHGEKEPLKLTGHAEGRLFVVKVCEPALDTKEDVSRYLRFLLPELSDPQAESIAAVCGCKNEGKDLFSFLLRKDTEPLLMQTLSRTKKKQELARQLIQKAVALSGQDSLFQELLLCGVPYDAIWKTIRDGETEQSIQEHPYMLLTKHGGSIFAADHYAKKHGFLPYSMQRLKGILKSALQTYLDQGHTCATLKGITDVANYFIRKSDRMDGSEEASFEIEPALSWYILSEMQAVCQFHEINGQYYLYFNRVWEEESAVIAHVRRLNRVKKEYLYKIQMSEIEESLKITYNKEQRNAFRLLNTSGVKILTGPPGSGKTALLRGLIQAFSQSGCGTIALAATTGMAAKVMTYACGIEDKQAGAKTVHSLLSLVPYQEGTFLGKTLNNPVDADFIIVDEASMMDLPICAALVSAVRSGSILLLVGDSDQLPSVGYGNILHDLINSGETEVYRLTEVLRQDNSGIYSNAAKIRDGKYPVSEKSFQIISCDSDMEAKQKLMQELKGKDFSKYLIMSPLKQKGPLSVSALNTSLQQMRPNLRRNGVCTYGNRTYHVNDKVIMTKNEYDKGYINGDVGQIAEITQEQMAVIFPDGIGGIKVMDKDDLCNMDLAYAITIHKAQGSEAETAYLVLPDGAENMLSKRLVYTAVTRARKKVVIYEVNHALQKAIEKKEKKQERITMLKERFLAYCN